MSTTVAPYRSTKSVPDRVDAAWAKGYATGLAERPNVLRWAIGAGVLVMLARWMGHRSPVVKLWVALALACATVIVLAVAAAASLVALVRWAIRRHGHPSPASTGFLLTEGAATYPVTCAGDKSKGWGPF